MQSKHNSPSLLTEMQDGFITLENSLSVLSCDVEAPFLSKTQRWIHLKLCAQMCIVAIFITATAGYNLNIYHLNKTQAKYRLLYT